MNKGSVGALIWALLVICLLFLTYIMLTPVI